MTRTMAAAACSMLIFLAGAKTKVEKTPDAPPASPPRKILVLVVTSDPSARDLVEDVIAGELSLGGATAVASHVLFPEMPKERGPFEEKLVAEGFDAVTVSRPVGRDDKLEWKEGTLSYTPQYMGMGYWGGYWYTYEQVFLPGYLEKETRVRVRTDLWRASGKEGSLVWSGTSELVDPMTMPQAAREIGASVAKALRKAKLI